MTHMNIEMRVNVDPQAVADAVLKELGEKRHLARPAQIAFEPGELFRFEIDRVSIIDGRHVRARDVNVYLDGERLKMVKTAAATPRGFAVQFKISKYANWDILEDERAHDIRVTVNDPNTGEVFKEWEILDLVFWCHSGGQGYVTFNSKPKNAWIS